MSCHSWVYIMYYTYILHCKYFTFWPYCHLSYWVIVRFQIWWEPFRLVSQCETPQKNRLSYNFIFNVVLNYSVSGWTEMLNHTFFFSLSTVSFCLLSHLQPFLSIVWTMMYCLPIEPSTTPGKVRTLWTGTRSHFQMQSFLLNSALRGNHYLIFPIDIKMNTHVLCQLVGKKRQLIQTKCSFIP